jgi:hypothetical protein
MKKLVIVSALLFSAAVLRAGALTSTAEAGDAKWFAFYKPRWSVDLKGGGALPLGDLATYNSTGSSVGADLIYQGTRSVGTDLFISYSSQPYKLGGGASPLNNLGFGLKLLYEVMRVEDLNAWIGAGAGYYLTQRTRQVLVTPVTTPVQYTADSQSTGGLGLLFCFGTSYNMSRHVAITLDVSLVNIALSGGTADSITLGLPTAGLRYDF